jgi:hypothetical protein
LSAFYGAFYFLGNPLLGDFCFGDPLLGNFFFGDPLLGDFCFGDPLLGGNFLFACLVFF